MKKIAFTINSDYTSTIHLSSTLIYEATYRGAQKEASTKKTRAMSVTPVQ